MSQLYAEEFQDIPTTLVANDGLRNRILALIDTEGMAGKVTEGGNRLDSFRDVLKQLVEGNLSLSQAIARTEQELPRSGSVHVYNNRVFPHDWAERQVRTQYSRFYNQAVMEQLIAEGQTECFVPHSSQEDRGSKCSLYLAGHNNDLRALHERLVASYSKGNWSKDLKIPEHPHCTHVVAPAR
ncbi:MAG: hypothetical protein QOH93_2862 [Chloroflexia bacterium]|nr:hypothetical protein [Chloroflexia bacterium]